MNYGYRYKRSEYAARGITEYWLVEHPEKAKVTVLTLVDGLYEAVELGGDDRLQSLQFPALELVVSQVLNPRRGG